MVSGVSLCTAVSHGGAQTGDRGQLANDGDTLVGLDAVHN